MSSLPKKLPRFTAPEKLKLALTHRSYANEHFESSNNERLEFLGDAILNFLSGEFLYKKFPHLAEGKLTSLRASMVDAKQLAEFAIALDLGHKIYLGHGAELGGGRQNPRILSSTFEAMIGAYFLDQNSDIERIRQYVVPFFEAVIARYKASQQPGIVPNVEQVSGQSSSLKGTLASAQSEIKDQGAWNHLQPGRTNYKSRFQEWVQSQFAENPTYVIVSESGPDHAKTFVAEVQVRGKAYGCGTGHKKQEAEKSAAKDALNKLHQLPEE